MNIITISREFGSGGRELGKRLSDLLGYDYYDKEIIDEIARKTSLDRGYVEKSLETGASRAFPFTFRRSIVSFSGTQNAKTELLIEERNAILEIAKQNKSFVIVGRNADEILKEYSPLNIFVYASMESKIERCIKKDDGTNTPSRKELEKSIKSIDAARKRTRALVSSSEWGDKSNYHFCLNTTGWEIKDIVPLVSSIAKDYFKENENSAI